MQNLQISNIRKNNVFQTPKAYLPSFKSGKITDLQTDTVEISNHKDKLGKKIFFSTLGIGALIFALIKFHKISAIKSKENLSAELKEIQQIYKDIFKQDINAKETKEFAERYKKIIESKTPENDKEYCEKLLEEICKDRQTQKPQIGRWIENKADADLICADNAGMATMPDGRTIDIYIYNFRNDPAAPDINKSLFETLFHETHHVKQKEMFYRTDREGFMQYLLNAFIFDGKSEKYKAMLRTNNGDKEKTIAQAKQLIFNTIDSHWGNLPPFEKNSAEYQEGLKIIKGIKNYKPFWKCNSNSEYKKQIIENGAYADGEKAERLFDLLKQINI